MEYIPLDEQSSESCLLCIKTSTVSCPFRNDGEQTYENCQRAVAYNGSIKSKLDVKFSFTVLFLTFSHLLKGCNLFLIYGPYLFV